MNVWAAGRVLLAGAAVACGDQWIMWETSFRLGPPQGRRMLAMAEANGEVAVRDPDALVKEIERTRENLARTIDALTQRVSPGNIARRAASRLRDQAARPEVQMASGAVLVAVVATVYLGWRLRRR